MTTTDAIRDALREKLRSMPRNMRLCIMLGYADGLTDAECAAALGITTAQAARCREVALNQLKETANKAGRAGESVTSEYPTVRNEGHNSCPPTGLEA